MSTGFVVNPGRAGHASGGARGRRVTCVPAPTPLVNDEHDGVATRGAPTVWCVADISTSCFLQPLVSTIAVCSAVSGEMENATIRARGRGHISEIKVTIG